ncbi:serine protease [Paraburkholderia translucens]|uniref:S1 family peptidase n=1 Tax=Paraburkholderia translucens TaxID=2886945 RepID=UPI002E7A3670|nr:serine protease [Paraburkholderia sp. MMS20-SJTN17]
MKANSVELYVSPNGDTWLLGIGADELPVVHHVPNAASGGRPSEISVATFLSSGQAGPQRDALLQLIGQFVRDRANLPPTSSGIRAALSRPAADALLLTGARVRTFAHTDHLTNASSFFFARDGRLFLVTSRHVVSDEPSGHFPDRLQIELHIDPDDLGASTWFSIPLYADSVGLWRQGEDDAGSIDVAVLEIHRDRLPPNAVFSSFGPEHLPRPGDVVPVGASVLVVGFPLGFHDSLHHLPVVRQGVIASAFGLRFQGKGCFITDARTHRGTSGAPVVMSNVSTGQATTGARLPWMLLGVHSSAIDMGARDLHIDETLGLNSAWYSDVLMTLTSS